VQTLLHRSDGVGLPLKQHIDEGTVQVRQIDPTELTSGELSHTLIKATRKDSIRVAVMDSLNGYAYAMPDEDYLSLHLHELASYLSQQSVTTVFTMTQHGLITERPQQPFDVSYVADSVILFRNFEFGGQIHKAVSVYKSRSSSHETAIRLLQIDRSGLHVGEPLVQFKGVLTGSPVFLGDKLHGHGFFDSADG
jgi:circadian clock protein KaiC